MTPIRYRSLASVLREWYGRPVPKIGLDAGFGCPNRGPDGRSAAGCVYCNNATFSSGNPAKSIREQIQAALGFLSTSQRWAPPEGKALQAIAYLQSYSNTWASTEILRQRYNEALSVTHIAGLAISTRPDCIDPAIADLLAEFHTRTQLWIELGLQTTSPAALGWIRRGHDVHSFTAACTLLHARGLRTVVHLIPGLPGETAADRRSCSRLLADLAVWGIKFHHLQIVRDTPLESLAQSGTVFQPRAEEYAEMVADILHNTGTPVVHRLFSTCRPELLSPLDQSDPEIPGLMRRLFRPW